MSKTMLVQRLGVLFLCLVLTAVLVATAVTVSAIKENINSENVLQLSTVIVDAGHGGFDGGAVVGKYVEKNINLSIALTLSDMLKSNGYNVILTRNDDSSTESNSKSSIGARKKSDLQNRLALMRENTNAIFVSIHLNKYNSSSAKGAQVFFSSKSEGSEQLANCVMQSIVTRVQPDNKRVIKKNFNSTYILKNAPIPAIIAECGFMSNPNELNSLLNSDYQKKLAFAIMCGIEDYY